MRRKRSHSQTNLSDHIFCTQANALQLPFAAQTFDAVIAIRFFHLLPVPLHRPFLLEMWRVLRPGGVLLVQFRSALTGGVLVWLHEYARRHLQKRKPRYYLWPHQVAPLFKEMADFSLHGISPTGIRFLHRLHPNSASTVEELTREGWRTFFAHRRIFVRIVKA